MVKFSSRPQTLKPSDFKYYLTDDVLLDIYKEINKADSPERRVDEFYMHLLLEIFTRQEKFRVLPQEVIEGTLEKPDFTIRYVRSPANQKIILCESKKREHESQSCMWREALDQVVRYAIQVREEPSHDRRKPMYLTVNIGTYLRFYELPPRSGNVKDWAPARGICYELADDEEKVWKLYHQLRDLTKSAFGH